MRKIDHKKMANFSKRFDAIRELSNVLPVSQRHQYVLNQVKQGGFIRMDGTLYKVQEIYTYEERSKKGKVTWQWHELALYDVENGLIKYLEMEDDDGLELSITNEQLKVRQLDVNYKDILSMVDEEEGSFTYKSGRYYYEDDCKAFFIASGDEQEVRLYEFESDDNEYITVEAWGEDADEYEIHHSRSIDEEAIEIVSLGA